MLSLIGESIVALLVAISICEVAKHSMPKALGLIAGLLIVVAIWLSHIIDMKPEK